MTKKKIRVNEIFTYGLIYICSLLSVSILVLIIVYVLSKGLKGVTPQFLTTVTSVRKGTVGIAGNIVNTILMSPTLLKKSSNRKI